MVKTHVSNVKTWAQSLVRELRSHIPRGEKKKKIIVASRQKGEVKAGTEEGTWRVSGLLVVRLFLIWVVVTEVLHDYTNLHNNINVLKHSCV